MVTHSGASLHRWRYFPLRSPLSSSALWSHTQHLVPPRTVYLSLSHKKKKKKKPAARNLPEVISFICNIFLPLFFFFLLEWWKLGQETAGEVRFCVTSRRRRRSGPRGRTSGRRRSCQSSARHESEAPESARGARYVNEGNFHKLGLAQTEAATEIHKETVREIRGRVQKTDNQFKYHTYLYRKTCCDGEVIKANPRLDWSDSPADDVSIFKFVSNVHLFMNDVQRRHILQLCVWISTQYLVHWIICVHHDVILQKVWFGP